MSQYNVPDKSTGETWSAAEHNQLKFAHNATDARVTQTEADITALEISQAAQDLALSGNDTDIAALQAGQASQNNSIAANAAAVATNAVDITNLQAEQTTQDTKIASLETRGEPLGFWNADTNTPDLSVAPAKDNDFYLVSAAGTTTVNGESSWAEGDTIIAQGGQWVKAPETAGTVKPVIDNSVTTDIQTLAATPLPADGPGRVIGEAGVSWNPEGPGSTVTNIVNILTSSGRPVPVAVSVTQLNAAGSSNPIMTLGATGVFAFANQNRDVEVIAHVLDDAFGRPYNGRIALHAASLAASEGLVFTDVSPVTEYAQGPEGQNISGALPYTGAWNNNNNGNTSGFGFGASNRIAFRKLNVSSAGGSVVLSLMDEPTAPEQDPCDVTESLSARIGQLSAPAPETVYESGTGAFRVATFQPAMPINVTGTDMIVSTGFNLAAAGEFFLKFEVSDNGGATRAWQTGELRLTTLIERFNAGDAVDGYVTLFDNDHVIINISDLATGDLLMREAGRDFGIRSIELWQVATSDPGSVSNTDFIQRGTITMASSVENVVFPEAFADATYQFVAMARDNQAYYINQTAIAGSKTAAQIQVGGYTATGSSVAVTFDWVAIGTKANP